MNAQFYIDRLGLISHPEGGFYKETYRSEGVIPKEALPDIFNGNRCYATAIYFLLRTGEFSAFHRIASDETWHFYAGQALVVAEITLDGRLHKTELGAELGTGQLLQYTVKAGNWFGSYTTAANSFSLVGCTVAPGFDFEDFEMPSRGELLKLFPQHEEVIVALTRK
jgi:predicted cupin superfamily sugar epimerase